MKKFVYIFLVFVVCAAIGFCVPQFLLKPAAEPSITVKEQPKQVDSEEPVIPVAEEKEMAKPEPKQEETVNPEPEVTPQPAAIPESERITASELQNVIMSTNPGQYRKLIDARLRKPYTIKYIGVSAGETEGWPQDYLGLNTFIYTYNQFESVKVLKVYYDASGLLVQADVQVTKKSFDDAVADENEE